ncbi:MAG: hypothetical protein ACE5JS_06905, partial [Nitrospinota bacterium]
MLTLLIVSFLIGVGIASVLVLTLRSRKVRPSFDDEPSGFETELISDDRAEGPTDRSRGATLPSHPGLGFPKEYSPHADPDQVPVHLGTGELGTEAPEPLTSESVTAESPSPESIRP